MNRFFSSGSSIFMFRFNEFCSFCRVFLVIVLIFFTSPNTLYLSLSDVLFILSALSLSLVYYFFFIFLSLLIPSVFSFLGHCSFFFLYKFFVSLFFSFLFLFLVNSIALSLRLLLYKHS